MTVIAVLYIAALAGVIVGIAVSPERTYNGVPAAVNLISLVVLGLILAIGQLS